MKNKWRITLWVMNISVLAIVLAVILWHGAGKWNAQKTGEGQQEADPNEIVTVWCLSEVRYGKPDEEKRTTYTFEYDEFGNMLSFTKYYSDHYSEELGRKSDTDYYAYDARGNCIYKCFGRKEYLLTYDEKDRVLTETECWDGQEQQQYVYTYDESGRILTTTERHSEYESKDINTYDAQGNLIQTEHLYNGKRTMCETWTYDEKGRELTYTEEYTSESQTYLNCRAYYEYDIRGNVISYKWYQCDRLRTEITNTYDLFGRLKTEKKIEDGNNTYEKTYFYDQKGNLQRVESYYPRRGEQAGNGDMQLVVTTYEYDKWGNVCQQTTVYEDGHTVIYRCTYDACGNVLSEGYDDSYRIERTYDQWGNILTRTYISSYAYETVYIYVSFQVPRWRAEKIGNQQGAYIDMHGFPG